MFYKYQKSITTNKTKLDLYPAFSYQVLEKHQEDISFRSEKSSRFFTRIMRLPISRESLAEKECVQQKSLKDGVDKLMRKFLQSIAHNSSYKNVYNVISDYSAHK